MDRLVSLHTARRRTGRPLVVEEMGNLEGRTIATGISAYDLGRSQESSRGKSS